MNATVLIKASLIEGLVALGRLSPICVLGKTAFVIQFNIKNEFNLF